VNVRARKKIFNVLKIKLTFIDRTEDGAALHLSGFSESDN